MVACLPRDDEQPTTKIPAHRLSGTLHVSLTEYQAENALLGRLLQDSQARCDQTGKRLTAAKRRAADAERQQEFMSKRLEQGAAMVVSLISHARASFPKACRTPIGALHAIAG